MHETNALLLADMIEAFEETYQEFLTDHELLDVPVVKLGFYTAAMKMAAKYPVPETDVQTGVVEYLEEEIRDALGADDGDLLSSIEFTFIAVSEKQQEKRRGQIHVVVNRDEWASWMS